MISPPGAARAPGALSARTSRESFRQEALASWSAYQETGRHLSLEEVRAGLGTWGAEAEAEPPECHE
jgi:predicted transcriptional regulator